MSVDDTADFVNLETSKVTEVELNKKVKDVMWPWVKTPFAVNNFDNRFKAQEKLLHEQHKMIKGVFEWIFSLLLNFDL